MSLKFVRKTFLKSFLLIYIFAFASLYCQSRGLYGENGILPARLVVPKEPRSFTELLSDRPTLLSFSGRLGLTVSQCIDFLCLLGMTISCLGFVWDSMCDGITFGILWILYFSLYQVGQTFLWFQWDILLLESGILCILLAPLFSSDQSEIKDVIGLFMIRWLLFRLMYASGVVKLTSECPTWWGLTALDWHYESQCIPTPLAWYFHQLPAWFQRLSVVATFVIEIPIPFLFFAPVRNLRLFAFWSQMLLQVLIILTGNYNFFNLLTILLCLSLLEDRDLPTWITGFKQYEDGTTNNRGIFHGLIRKIQFLLSMISYGVLIVGTVVLFDLEFDKSTKEVKSQITFSKKAFYVFVQKSLTFGILLGALSFLWSIFKALNECANVKGFFSKIWSFACCVSVCVAASAIFTASLVPLCYVDGPTHSRLPHSVKKLHQDLHQFSAVNSYGLFRSMTGVGGRPEVVIEGSEDYSGPWKEYHFLYKPGNISAKLPFVAPHQPRLDWQMWFAALGSYQHNAWFINFAYRLLTNEPDVVALIKENPFPRRPPKVIRAKSYHYHYTKLMPNKRLPKNWWWREYSEEYLPPISLSDTNLIEYLRRNGMIGRQPKPRSSNVLSVVVDRLRHKIGQPEGFSFLMSILIACVFTRFILSFVLR